MKNHIRQPVTLTPQQAEVIFKAGNAILQISENHQPGNEFPFYALEILAEQLNNAIDENGGFVFEAVY